jgi:hypothetical protein
MARLSPEFGRLRGLGVSGRADTPNLIYDDGAAYPGRG